MFEELAGKKKGFSLSRLITLWRVGREGSIGEASAGKPNVQTQYSRQIAELEEYLGVDLLRRDVKPHALTDEGQRLYEICNDCLPALDDFVSTCKELPQRVAIGAGESLIQWVLMPKWVGPLRAKFPGVALSFRNLQTSEIVTMLRDGEIDLGLVRKRAVPKGLESFPYNKLEQRLFVPEALKKGLSDPVDIKTVAELPLAVLEGSGLARKTLDSLFLDGEVQPNYALECSSSTQIARAVGEMGFCGFLPTVAKKSLPASVGSYRVKGLENLDRNLVFAWNPRRARQRIEIEKLVGALGYKPKPRKRAVAKKKKGRTRKS